MSFSHEEFSNLGGVLTCIKPDPQRKDVRDADDSQANHLILTRGLMYTSKQYKKL